MLASTGGLTTTQRLPPATSKPVASNQAPGRGFLPHPAFWSRCITQHAYLTYLIDLEADGHGLEAAVYLLDLPDPKAMWARRA